MLCKIMVLTIILQFSQHSNKLPLPRWKQVNCPVIAIYARQVGDIPGHAEIVFWPSRWTSRDAEKLSPLGIDDLLPQENWYIHTLVSRKNQISDLVCPRTVKIIQNSLRNELFNLFVRVQHNYILFFKSINIHPLLNPAVSACLGYLSNSLIF